MMNFNVIRERLEDGDIEGALKLALNSDNPLITVEMLSLILKHVETVEDYELILAYIEEALRNITNTLEKVKALSIVAESLYTTGAESTGWRYFELAIRTAQSIDFFKWRAEAFANIASMMVLSGFVDDAYHYYNLAFKSLSESKEQYSVIVPLLSNLADEIIESADRIHDGRALDLYELAREIYLFINRRLTASTIEEKINTINTVLKNGCIAITEFLEVGDIDKAIFAVRYLEDREKPVALMNVAYWLFLHGQEKLARILLKDAYDIIFLRKLKPHDLTLEGIAYRFMKLGLIDDALNIAGIIENERISDEILGRIALTYSKKGETEKAKDILNVIKSESVKSKVLKAIQGEEHVGYE